MVTTLTQKLLHFNRSIKLSNDGSALSSETGDLVFREIDEKLGFSKTIAEHLQLKDKRSYLIHSNEQLLRQKIYQLTAGYHKDDATDEMTHDPVFTQVLETQTLASQTSLSRFFHGFDDYAIEHLQAANQALIDKVHRLRKIETLLIDLDSSHADT